MEFKIVYDKIVRSSSVAMLPDDTSV